MKQACKVMHKKLHKAVVSGKHTFVFPQEAHCKEKYFSHPGSGTVRCPETLQIPDDLLLFSFEVE
eukprot:185057-Pelagomonas_calceolata.AAC.1